jgi:hypothetical protein
VTSNQSDWKQTYLFAKQQTQRAIRARTVLLDFKEKKVNVLARGKMASKLPKTDPASKDPQ